MSNPLHCEYVAKQHLVAELMVLTGADALNVFQHRRQLESLSLDELVKLREDCFEDLDAKFSIV